MKKIENFLISLVRIGFATVVGFLQLLLLAGIAFGVLYGFFFGLKFITNYFLLDKDTVFLYVFFYPSLVLALIYCYCVGKEVIEWRKK